MKRGHTRWAMVALRACSLLVPGYRRRDWLEEWGGELEALARARAEGRAGAYPGTMAFVVGALPHAVWMRKEEWTMESVAQDLKYAARVLRRSPGFTLVAALTLALGIGANAAMFSMVNGLMFRSPPGIQDPDRLVQIARSYDDAPRWDNWSWPAAKLIGEESDVFSGVAGYSGFSFVLGRGEDSEGVMGQYVSGSYFEVLGVRPALGRLLDGRDEVAPGVHRTLVLSHGLWLRRFGGDPGVVGQTVPVGSELYEVVGVAPEGFTGVDVLGTAPELWVPAYQRTSSSGTPLFDQWGSSWFYLFGRLGNGVALETAAAAMDVVSGRLRSASDVNEGIRVLLAPGIGLSPEEREAGGQITLLLSGIAALVLLLTCANVANLFLARTTTRTAEMGVRQALGAGRGRLARQLVTESVILSLVATVLAVPLLGGAATVLPSLFPMTVAVSLAPDFRVYAFMATVGVLAGLLFGAVPSFAMSRWDLARGLREGGTTGGRRRTRLRDALVVGQLALSLGLVSGAALLGRSVLNARGADPGFNPDGLVVGQLNLRSTGRYQEEGAVAGFQERLLLELERIPGVEAAALAGQAPVLGGHGRASVVPAELENDPNAGVEAEYTPVTPTYFETLGIPLLQGRTFRDAAEEPEPVVVVNQALARLFWPGEDPLGRELWRQGHPVRVVGVVADVQMRSLRAAANPGVYYPYHQEESPYMALHVRTQGPTASLAPALKRAVAAVDPGLPLTGITDLREGLARSLSETRTFVLVVATFAGLALVLSLIGLYGLITHGVSQRARELGIRIALGAGRGELVRMVLMRAVTLTAGGMVLGVGVSLALGRALRGVLFGVSPSNPLALGLALILMGAMCLLAAWLPARRAGQVDAMVSLRE